MGGSKLYSFSQTLHEHKGDYAPGGSAPKTLQGQLLSLCEMISLDYWVKSIISSTEPEEEGGWGDWSRSLPLRYAFVYYDIVYNTWTARMSNV